MAISGSESARKLFGLGEPSYAPTNDPRQPEEGISPRERGEAAIALVAEAMAELASIIDELSESSNVSAAGAEGEEEPVR
jgi:hypothetical protein